jgi:small subunit ribosomal protein S17
MADDEVTGDAVIEDAVAGDEATEETETPEQQPETDSTAEKADSSVEPEAEPEPEAASATAASRSPRPTETSITSSRAGAGDSDDGRPNRRKVREGLVVSIKMDKTAVVGVVERVRHPRYAKTVQRTKRLYAHDTENDLRVGDRVRVAETRPLSKLKRWRVVEVLERAK